MRLFKALGVLVLVSAVMAAGSLLLGSLVSWAFADSHPVYAQVPHGYSNFGQPGWVRFAPGDDMSCLSSHGNHLCVPEQHRPNRTRTVRTETQRVCTAAEAEAHRGRAVRCVTLCQQAFGERGDASDRHCFDAAIPTGTPLPPGRDCPALVGVTQAALDDAARVDVDLAYANRHLAGVGLPATVPSEGIVSVELRDGTVLPASVIESVVIVDAGSLLASVIYFTDSAIGPVTADAGCSQQPA